MAIGASNPTGVPNGRDLHVVCQKKGGKKGRHLRVMRTLYWEVISDEALARELPIPTSVVWHGYRFSVAEIDLEGKLFPITIQIISSQQGKVIWWPNTGWRRKFPPASGRYSRIGCLMGLTSVRMDLPRTRKKRIKRRNNLPSAGVRPQQFILLGV